MQKVKYSLFYDFHTLASIPDVGSKFDADLFTDRLKECGINFLTTHARCNQGNAYYFTKVGRRHPALKRDLIMELSTACRRKGIQFCAYMNALLSEEEFQAHPEYMDQPLHPERRNRNVPFFRRCCYNSPFVEHVIEMVKELATGYPVDGFFFDCMLPGDCVCPTCVKMMREQGIDPTDEEAVAAFSAASATRYAKRLNDAIRSIKPDALLFFNGRPFEDVCDMESHIEAECLPTSVWGYECLPLLAHHLRTLVPADKQILNMTGRFNAWSDFGSMRTKAGLEYDFFYGIANGMRPDIGDHLPPDGEWPLPVFKLVKDVYSTLQQYDEWSMDAVNRPDVAVVHPRLKGKMDFYPDSESLKACTRMLTELKVQFNIVNEASSWDNYKLLIFPDVVPFDDEITRRVRRHLAKGGKILATAESGLTPAANGPRAFALGDEWPARYCETSTAVPFYFRPDGKFATDLPDMPLIMYANGVIVEPTQDAEMSMRSILPYASKGWDGLHCNYYAPPRPDSVGSFILEKNNIVYVAGELFRGYYVKAPKQVKDLVRNLLAYLDETPMLKVENVPSFSRAFLQFNQEKLLVNFFTYCPEKRCESIALEDRPTVIDATFSVRLDGKKVARVYQAPSRKSLDFTVNGDYVTFTIPRTDGYTLAVIE